MLAAGPGHPAFVRFLQSFGVIAAFGVVAIALAIRGALDHFEVIHESFHTSPDLGEPWRNLGTTSAQPHRRLARAPLPQNVGDQAAAPSGDVGEENGAEGAAQPAPVALAPRVAKRVLALDDHWTVLQDRLREALPTFVTMQVNLVPDLYDALVHVPEQTRAAVLAPLGAALQARATQLAAFVGGDELDGEELGERVAAMAGELLDEESVRLLARGGAELGADADVAAVEAWLLGPGGVEIARALLGQILRIGAETQMEWLQRVPAMP